LFQNSYEELYSQFENPPNLLRCS